MSRHSIFRRASHVVCALLPLLPTVASAAPDVPLARLKHASTVRAIAFAPDGQTLVTGNQGGATIQLWQVPAGKLLRSIPAPPGGAYVLAFSPDGKTMAASGVGPAVHLYEMPAGKEIRQLRGHAKPVSCLAFSPDGKRLASGGQDNLIRVWDLTTSNEAKQLQEPDSVTALAFSPDGRLLASAVWALPIHIWDLGEAKVVRQCSGHRDTVVALAFSPDGKMLATGSLDGTARLWEVVTAAPIFTMDEHGGQVNAVAFSRDGRRLATAGGDRMLYVWDLAWLREGQRLEHQGPLFTVAFSPDGKQVAAGGADTLAQVWAVQPPGPPPPMPKRTSRKAAKRTPLPVQDLPVLAARAVGMAASPRGQGLCGSLPVLQAGRSQLEPHWRFLAQSDPWSAYMATWRMREAPGLSLILLRERLLPFAVSAERWHITQLVDELNSKQAKVREKATRELELLGELAEPTLRKALTGRLSSLEMRRRVERILEHIKKNKGESTTSPEVLRALRGITVLEAIGTPEARAILTKFTEGAADAPQTLDAKAALERLAKRRAP